MGHCAENQEEAHDGDDNEGMQVDEADGVNGRSSTNAREDVTGDNPEDDLDEDSDDFDDWELDSDISSDDSEDLGPKDGEDEQEDGEADFDCYDSL